MSKLQLISKDTHLTEEGSAIEPAMFMVAAHNSTEQELLDARIQVAQITRQLAEEKRANERLVILNEFNHKLENLTEIPVAAQIAATTLQKVLKCGLVCLLVYAPFEQRLVVLTTAGPLAHLIPPGYRHSTTRNLVGRAIRARKTLLSAPDYEPFLLSDQTFLSQMVTPLLYDGLLEGALVLAHPQAGQFSPADIPFVEALAARMLASWNYARHGQNLAELLKSAAAISNTLDLNKQLSQVAEVARRTVRAQFCLTAVLEDQDWRISSSGKAPNLLHSIETAPAALLADLMQTPKAFRLRDSRKSSRTAGIKLDTPELRSLLVSPIRLNDTSNGVILLFGKRTGVTFTEQDAYLMELLSAHAAVSFERCLLDSELRSMLKTTQLLYDLSLRVSQADDLNTAATVIARTAFRLFQASACGLVLYTENGEVEARVHFPADDTSIVHPDDLIHQAIGTRQIIYQTPSDAASRLAIPIQTSRRCYGALWLELTRPAPVDPRPVEDIRILINQAAIALERSILLSEKRQQADEIYHAYRQLEDSYDQTLLGLMKALDARDHETEKHTFRVTQIAVAIGRSMHLSDSELKALERGSLLHDIGKIGINDAILLKKGQLTDEEWQLMRKHTEIGAEIIQGIASLSDALPVIANHHERWNGSGYPRGLKAEEIPLLARIFAVADVFDALTSNRPYRVKESHAQAVQYLRSQAGILFDPQIVAFLNKIGNSLSFSSHLDA